MLGWQLDAGNPWLYPSRQLRDTTQKPEAALLARIFYRLTALGRIHVGQPTSNSP